MGNLLAYADDETKKKLSKLIVLVVDDQQEIRTLMREILEDIGVVCIFEADDGKSALEFISIGFSIVNLIISDWNMPGMSGIDFLRQLRTTHPDMLFLMVTGRSNRNAVIEAKAAGVSAYIRKPFSPKQLEEKLSALLRHRPLA